MKTTHIIILILLIIITDLIVALFSMVIWIYTISGCVCEFDFILYLKLYIFLDK